MTAATSSKTASRSRRKIQWRGLWLEGCKPPHGYGATVVERQSEKYTLSASPRLIILPVEIASPLPLRWLDRLNSLINASRFFQDRHVADTGYRRQIVDKARMARQQRRVFQTRHRLPHPTITRPIHAASSCDIRRESAKRCCTGNSRRDILNPSAPDRYRRARHKRREPTARQERSRPKVRMRGLLRAGSEPVPANWFRTASATGRR